MASSPTRQVSCQTARVGFRLAEIPEVFMEYRRLGKSGLPISALSFGSWVTFANQLDLSSSEKCMKMAYEAGVNFFDNAEVYANGQSEILMGQVLKKMAWPRDTYLISSKVFWGGKLPTQRGLHRKHVVDACHAALKRLQVDYLDLYFCHRPDVATPMEETVRTMNDLIRQGKVLYWGTSEWSATQIMHAHAVAKELGLEPPVMEQPEYNMFHRDRVEREYGPLYRSVGLGTTIWSPLASGVLTGKYENGIPKDSRANVPGFEWLSDNFSSPAAKVKIEKTKHLRKIAERLDTTLPRFALAWCLKNPNVSTVILGASKPEQLKENLLALEDVAKLDAAVLSDVEAILQNQPSPEPVF